MTMKLVKIFWVADGVIWGLVILGFIGLVIFNRVRNRKRKDGNDE